MRQTALILALVFCVVLSAHFRLAARANAARCETMLKALPPPEDYEPSTRPVATDE